MESRIIEIVQELSVFINIPVILINQVSKKPKYPFATFSIMGNPNEGERQTISLYQKNMVNGEPDGNVRHKKYYKSKFPVQFDFYSAGKNGISQTSIKNIAVTAYLWLFNEGRQSINNKGFVIKPIDTSIQSRPSLNDDETEYRYGFDIELIGQLVKEEILETIENVDITIKKKR